MPRVILASGGKPLANCALTSQRTRIGRSPGNDIVLDSPDVSGVHAVLVQDGANLAIEDLASRNGTFVGERRVERQVLKDGDVVGIGGYTLTIVAEPAAMAYEPTMVVRPAVKPAYLQRVDGPAAGELIELNKVVTTVGGPGDCTAVCIRRGNDLAVRAGEGRVVGRLNGSELTGAPVPLASGDVLDLGSDRFRFVV